MMSNLNFKNDNKNLYKFLATSYDISILASKIDANNKKDFGIFKLKQMVNADKAIA